MKKIPNKPTAINGARLRLVNKKTGKLASSTNWLVDLAAEAKVLGGLIRSFRITAAEKSLKTFSSERTKAFQDT